MDFQLLGLQRKRIFLLITGLYLCAHTSVATPEVSCQLPVVLDMAYDAFDDQYVGCTEKMEKIIQSKLLQQEKSNLKSFKVSWEAAEKKWNARKKNISLPIGFKKEHGIAILIYTSGGRRRLFQDFNKAVRKAGRSQEYYLNRFPFKALHFYLTRALQLLRRDCAEMYKTKVYRGVKSVCYEPDKRDGNIRFGSFTSSSFNSDVARRFGLETFFTIRTCFGVPIADFSSLDEAEVLIPAYEHFKVSSFTQSKNGNKIVLHSTNKTFSYYNCAYIEVSAMIDWPRWRVREYRRVRRHLCDNISREPVHVGFPAIPKDLPCILMHAAVVIHCTLGCPLHKSL